MGEPAVLGNIWGQLGIILIYTEILFIVLENGPEVEIVQALLADQKLARLLAGEEICALVLIATSGLKLEQPEPGRNNTIGSQER
tara:strand:+ start:319 stop:573 length:255 start_codon:yes stop_codon:yes gene_type:complete